MFQRVINHPGGDEMYNIGQPTEPKRDYPGQPAAVQELEIVSVCVDSTHSDIEVRITGSDDAHPTYLFVGRGVHQASGCILPESSQQEFGVVSNRQATIRVTAKLRRIG